MSGNPTTTLPEVDVPEVLNVAVEYVDGAVAAGHGDRVAYIHESQQVTYAELQRGVNQAGNALAALGVELEHRVAILLPNRPEFVTSFFGAIKIGAVPTPMSFAVTPDEQTFLLADSRARAIVTTAALWGPLRERRGRWPFLRHVLIVGGGASQPGEHDFGTLVHEAPADLEAALTTSEDAAFWLHTSGSTGRPKWAVHLQRDMLHSERLYAAPFVELRPGDVIVCGSPCFHAYPLGFTTYFALKAGATVVLNAERSTPARMFHLVREHRATVFVGVPTLYAQMLQAASRGEPADLSSVRVCFAAAEPLAADLYRRWRERFRVEILDGIGTTEALHIFISNRAGEARPGSSGRAVPGYRIRLVDDSGADVPEGEIGNLLVSGGSVFAGYWHRQDVTRRVLQGEWYHTGDKYRQDVDGYYWYIGRADDLLRVSGHWVSPAEVEAALVSHPAVLEAAVVGQEDSDGLIKPKAFVVLRDGFQAADRLAEELKAHVKSTIAPYQYPRWIEFDDALPKTATGKIQRYKLR
ncbi:MAG: benzoate-CoA ligase family protein [Candidatus Rokuibacteriota bacterium]